MKLFVAVLVVAAAAACAQAACGTCESACDLPLPALISGNTVGQPLSNVSCVYQMGNTGLLFFFFFIIIF